MDHRAEGWYRRRTTHWQHKHQANHDLAVMAAELLAVAARRHGGPHRLMPGSSLEQFDREGGELRQRSRAVPMDERPPAGSLPGAGSFRLACSAE